MRTENAIEMITKAPKAGRWGKLVLDALEGADPNHGQPGKVNPAKLAAAIAKAKDLAVTTRRSPKGAGVHYAIREPSPSKDVPGKLVAYGYSNTEADAMLHAILGAVRENFQKAA